MAYNYFRCFRHTPPVRYAAEQPKKNAKEFLSSVFASPMCPTCGKTMVFDGSGEAAVDVRPDPPPQPYIPEAKLPDAQSIYEGSGTNPGHGHVEWKISRNPALAALTIKLTLGGRAGTVKFFKLADGLLNTGQPGAKQDWWLTAPMKCNPIAIVWHTINLSQLLGAAKPAALPDTLTIGVKLGNEKFGLIHLLAGHATSLRNVGPKYGIATSGDPRDDVYSTLLLLQSGLQRFKESDLRQINYDAGADKLLLKGSHSGLIAVSRRRGDPHFNIVTAYNTSAPAFGTVIYRR